MGKLKYTEKLTDDICARLSQGDSLVKVCKDLKMDRSTIYDWFRKYPDFLVNYKMAKDESAHADMEKLEALADRLLNPEEGDKLHPNAARVAADILKWAAARKAPTKFGNNIPVDPTTPNKITQVEIIDNRDKKKDDETTK